MSLVTWAYIVERYGVRLSMKQLAEVLNVQPRTLNNQISAGTCRVKTYKDPSGSRWADARDVSDYLDDLRLLAA